MVTSTIKTRALKIVFILTLCKCILGDDESAEKLSKVHNVVTEVRDNGHKVVKILEKVDTTLNNIHKDNGKFIGKLDKRSKQDDDFHNTVIKTLEEIEATQTDLKKQLLKWKKEKKDDITPAKEINLHLTSGTTVHKVGSIDEKAQDKDFGENATVVVWTIPGIKNIIHNFQTVQAYTIISDHFEIKEHGYKVRARLMLDKASEKIEILLDYFENPKNIPNFIQSRKYKLLVQDPSKGKSITVVDPALFGKLHAERMLDEYISETNFFPVRLLDSHPEYVSNDDIKILIAIEPASDHFSKVISINGSITWEIKEYSKKKQNEIDGLTYGYFSKFFYTSTKGYLMQVQLNFNGLGEGKDEYASIYVGFLVGAWDDNITEYPTYKVQFTILDQSDSLLKTDLTLSLEHTYNETDTYYGYDEFFSHSDIEQFPYLVNDVIKVKVNVEVSAETI